MAGRYRRRRRQTYPGVVQRLIATLRRTVHPPGHALHITLTAIPVERMDAMNQNNRIFDGLGRVMNEAAGVADGVRREVETVVKSQAQRIVNDMDLVKREDFDALRELVQVQGEEIDALRKEVAALKGATKA